MRKAEGMSNPPPQGQGLVSSRDLCARLGIDRSTLTRWVRDGKIAPTFRLEGRTGAHLFAEADVARLERDRAAA